MQHCGRHGRASRIGNSGKSLGCLSTAPQPEQKGDPGCAIGAVFEVAAIVGIRLFDADQATLATGISATT
ncbi:hypothetical protein GGD56_004358 [Rhizobium mongolense]|uniref:Uncharacterized protein n=1 Tax=Rhizobium mongolense TaxID=57676 RepID=A0ABR6IRH8_9HYPH|nr:hypothetical protein [Rhizobium mongolense]MBB4230505.1 hypothetical protein [Rhizobium mongolense]